MIKVKATITFEAHTETVFAELFKSGAARENGNEERKKERKTSQFQYKYQEL